MSAEVSIQHPAGRPRVRLFLMMLLQLFATVYIFVDAYFPTDVRSSAQGLFNVMILGVGALVANSLCAWLLQTAYTVDGITDFKSMFMIPMTISMLAALLFAFRFRPPSDQESGCDVVGDLQAGSVGAQSQRNC